MSQEQEKSHEPVTFDEHGYPEACSCEKCRELYWPIIVNGG